MLVDFEGPTLICVDGVFDLAAAQRVAAVLLEAGSRRAIRIDLTRVREFHDCGVALLASAIASGRAPAKVLGLHEHHLRLLRHLHIQCAEADLRAGVELA